MQRFLSVMRPTRVNGAVQIAVIEPLAYWITTISKKSVVIFKSEPGSGRS
jgi:hypothetical protein